MDTLKENKKKHLAINLTAQAVAFLVNILISFLLTPFIVENVGREAYGFVALANNFVSYAQIITTALNSMASRFVTIEIHRKNEEQVNSFVSSILIANIVISIVLVVPFAICLGSVSKLVDTPALIGDVTLLWSFIFMNFLISLIGNIFSIATYACNRLELSNLRLIEANLLKCVVLLVAYVFFTPHVWYVGLSSMVFTLYSLAKNISYTKKLLPQIQIRRKYFDLKKIKMLVLSGVWNSVSSLGNILTNGLDLLITNLLISAAAMGTISISKTVPTYILSLFSSLSNVFQPGITIAYAKNDYEGIKKQLIQAIMVLGMIACIPMAILFAYGEIFFSLWVPSQDARLLQLLAIVGCLEFPLVLSMEPMWGIFIAVNKIRQSALVVLLKSVTGLGVTFLILQFCNSDLQQMFVICGVTSIFNIIMSLTFLPLYGAYCLKLSWYTFYGPMFKNVLSVGIMTGISIAIKQILMPDSWGKLIVAAGITSILALILNYFLLFYGKSKEEFDIFEKTKKKFSKYIKF